MACGRKFGESTIDGKTEDVVCTDEGLCHVCRSENEAVVPDAVAPVLHVDESNYEATSGAAITE